MIVLPQLAYIGHALLNYTIANVGGPSTTIRGSGYWDTFTPNCTIEFIASLPTTPMSTSEIEAFESALPDAPHIVEMVSGGDYFKQLTRAPPGSTYLELDTNAVGKVRGSGKLMRFTAGGFIKLNAAVAKIFLRDPTAKSTEFGETEFWEPITVDTGEEGLDWLNTAMVLSQGRLLVEDGRAYGFELRLFMMVNGVAGSALEAEPETVVEAEVEVDAGDGEAEVEASVPTAEPSAPVRRSRRARRTYL